MSATDDVKVTQYYASEDPIKPASSKTGWLNFQENVSFNLSLPSGVGTYPRTVYVWFKDAYGNVSDRLEAGISLIVYDTTAPTAISVVIDGGSDNTTSTSVSLTLAATDDEAVTHFYASTSDSIPDLSDSGWTDYSTSVIYSFDNDSVGTKTVNVWFRDAAGNVSGSVADTIELEPSVYGERIAAGDRTTCAIRKNGTLSCWGSSSMGTIYNLPSSLGTVISVDAAREHACAIKSDNTVHCWGYNFKGAINVPWNLGTVKSISTSLEHTCAIKTDNTVRCWGGNDDGQINVPDNLSSVVSISAGIEHSCATKADGSAICWGSDVGGRSTVPSDLGAVKSVVAGDQLSCAMREDNTVRCWGWKPTLPADLGEIRSITSYDDFCAVTADRRVQCWGPATWSGYGKQNVPSDLESVSSVSNGESHTCAMTTSGRVRCWGSNFAGELNVPLDFQ